MSVELAVVELNGAVVVVLKGVVVVVADAQLDV